MSLISVTVLATINVQSSVDRDEMEVGDTFQLIVSVISEESVDVSDPRPPSLDGFELLNQSEHSTVSQNMVQTNSGMKFQTQRRQDFIYYLAARKVGRLSIDSFDIAVNGKSYRSNPVLVKVHERGKGPSQNSRQQRRKPKNPALDMLDDFERDQEEIFNRLLQGRQRMLEDAFPNGQFPGGNPNSGQQQPQARNLNINEKDAFFVLAEADKTEVYEGEQITVTWHIYTRGMLETLERLKFPDLRGFWKEVLEEVPAYQPYEEIVNGIPYKKALLAAHALFPIKAGSATIDEFKVRSRVRLPLTQYGTFGFGNAFEYTKSSRKINVTVKPLPLEGRPKDFSGAVGTYEVSASVDGGTNFPVDQPLSLKIRFEGVGNAKLIELPTLNFPEGIEVYDTKSESKFNKDGRSFKEFNILLVPHQKGSLEIPAIAVSMFDPVQKKYVTRMTQPISLTIVENPAGSRNQNSPQAKASNSKEGDETKANVQNLFPTLILSAEQGGVFPLLNQFPFWGVIYSFLIFILLWKARREFGWGLRKKSLKDRVQARWSIVDAAQKKSDYRKVGAEVTNILYLVLGELSGNQGGTQEFHRLLEQILPSLRAEYGKSLTQHFEFFQTLSFAPEEMLGNYKDDALIAENVQQMKAVIAHLF